MFSKQLSQIYSHARVYQGARDKPATPIWDYGRRTGNLRLTRDRAAR